MIFINNDNSTSEPSRNEKVIFIVSDSNEHRLKI